MHGWIAHLVPGLTKSFGTRHRCVRIAEHILRRAIPAAAECNTHARCCEYGLPIDIKGQFEVLLNSFSYANSFASVPNVIQQDGEFIASHSGHYARLGQSA